MAPYVPEVPEAVEIALRDWTEASRRMLLAVHTSGIIVGPGALPEHLEVSGVLAAAAIDMTRALLIYTALLTGRDVVAVNRELPRNPFDRPAT